MHGKAAEKIRDELDQDATDDPAQSAPEPVASDAERSARNIALWSSYLPRDCVDKMLEMGWDQST